ncbi:MAG: heparinase II/III family protein, partial [Fibrobacterota bacterium]
MVFNELDDAHSAIVECKTYYKNGDKRKAVNKLLEYYQNRDNVTWLFNHKDKARLIQQYRALCPEEIKSVVAVADSQLNGWWYWQKRYWNCGTPPNWLEKKEDNEYQIQLNRHPMFHVLGLAYWLTGNEKYAEAYTSMLAGWIDNIKMPDIKKYQDEKAWYVIQPWSLLNTGIRPKIWFESMEYFIGAPSFNADLLVRVLYSFIQHGKMLREVSSVAFPRADHNWYLMLMEGLFYVGTMLPELKTSHSDISQAMNELNRCMRTQVLEDGVHIEETPGYHNGAIGWFGAPLLLAKRNNMQFDSVYINKMEKMFNFSSHMTRPNHTVAPFGDSRPDTGGDWIFAFGSLIFGKKITAQEGRIYGPAFWFTNGALADSPDQNKNPVVKTDFPLNAYFPKGGFYCMRSSWDDNALYLAFRNGKAWFDSLRMAGHKHADHLSFDMSAYGSPLIV